MLPFQMAVKRSRVNLQLSPGRQAILTATRSSRGLSAGQRATPTLADKVDIVQNAIEAAALCKMADRGQITGGIFDGPLALDNAINLQAAEIKHINSPVAGRANVLIVPDVESGNILTKSLTFLAGAAVLVARARRAVPSRALS